MADVGMAPAQSRANPSESFDDVYRRQLGFVWRMLRYHGVPPAAIEDAVQDVFMTVHRRWADWDRSGSERSWLFGVVRRVAANHHRGQFRHERRQQVAPLPRGPRPVDEQVADRQALDALERALAELDEPLRTVFVLAQIEGLAAPEIAELVGSKLNTVYWRLRVARARVAEAMASTNQERA
ncbi:RNA polymerase sigma factor [Nannocystaceae bacterium ST9]